jgi:hypothetical protein
MEDEANSDTKVPDTKVPTASMSEPKEGTVDKTKASIDCQPNCNTLSIYFRKKPYLPQKGVMLPQAKKKRKQIQESHVSGRLKNWCWLVMIPGKNTYK